MSKNTSRRPLVLSFVLYAAVWAVWTLLLHSRLILWLQNGPLLLSVPFQYRTTILQAAQYVVLALPLLVYRWVAFGPREKLHKSVLPLWLMMVVEQLVSWRAAVMFNLPTYSEVISFVRDLSALMLIIVLLLFLAFCVVQWVVLTKLFRRFRRGGFLRLVTLLVVVGILAVVSANLEYISEYILRKLLVSSGEYRNIYSMYRSTPVIQEIPGMLGLFALQYWGIYTGYAAGTTAGKRPSPQPAPRQPAPAPRNPAPAPRPAQAPSGSSQRKQGDLYDEFLAFLGESGIGTPPPAKKEEKSFDAPVDKPIAKPVDKPYTPSDYTPEPEPESTSEPSDNEWI